MKEKCLCIRVTLGPFESKVFTHLTAVGVLFDNKVAYLYIAFVVGPLWKQGNLHITVEKKEPEASASLAFN